MLKKLIKIIKGNTIINVLIILTLLIAIGSAAMQFVLSQNKLSNQKKYKEMAFQIAEAGANYYRWHLAHVPDDYQDGTGQPGPYVHDYKDATGKVIGQYTLEITPPFISSNVVTIKSTGYLLDKQNLKKTVVIKMGINSLTRFAVVSNDFMRFGEGTEVFGPIHANGGIRFDGLAHNIITSAKEEYVDTDPDDCTPGKDHGVHTCLPPNPDPSPPNPIESRPDVFMAGREFPVPIVDFNGITSKLSTIKSDAQADGIYLGPSGTEGYYMHFNTNKTVDIYHVTSQKKCKYKIGGGKWRQYGQTKSVDTTASFTYEGSPSTGISIDVTGGFNGIIFAEDDVWVDGTIDDSRVSVVAAKEPLDTGAANIYVNNDLLYTHKDGTEVIGLIGQNDVAIGFYSEDDLEIDAAMIAKDGWIGRYYYQEYSGAQFDPAGCGDNVKRHQITTYGILATNQRYGFQWICNPGSYYCSGYDIRNLIFDDELAFSPPPSFPNTGGYEVISWEEE